ncbi:MAG: hypothetical protein KKD38_01880 [Candidatus Delongbacteria bacterium]|nr:hypothetical protein [Candidatus Delongbacteria bacterium]MCG2761429.1 hypothetical protein [Candidatus Delongbacteria bacterium]
MKKYLYITAISIIASLCSAVVLTTNNVTGSQMTFDDFGVVSSYIVGTKPPYTATEFLNYSSTFFVLNGSIPLEVNSTNATIWDNDPAEPYPGAFFMPGIYENWTYVNAGSTNVWSNVVKYQSGDINFIGGIGYKLMDPSPTLGNGYVEWMPVCQLTNMSSTDLTLKMFRYFRPVTTSGGIFYSNHGTVFDYDYDNTDGTSDDFARSFKNGGSINMFFGIGFPIDHYRIQNYNDPTIYNSLTNGVDDYSLTDKTDQVYANSSELAAQYKEYTLKQNQSLLYWILPKPILINNSAQNHPADFAYLTKEQSSLGNYDFTGTDVAANYTTLTFKTSGGGTPATSCKGTAVEIIGGMVESGLGNGISSVYTAKYWELFYDTRRNTSTENITFTYPDDAALTENSDYLRLVYRSDYDQNWTLWNDYSHDTGNRKLTANGFTGGDAHWAVAIVPVSTPANVMVVTATSSEVNLSWGAVSGATIYYIYRSSNPYSGFSQITTSDTNSYQDTDVLAGNKYFYYITADNAK